MQLVDFHSFYIEYSTQRRIATCLSRALTASLAEWLGSPT